MTSTKNQILTVSFSKKSVDLTPDINEQKTVFLSPQHGNCILFNVNVSPSIKKQLATQIETEKNAITFNIRLNYFTRISDAYKTNYELIIFRIFLSAQDALHVIYYDRARTFPSDLTYWNKRLAIKTNYYVSYSSAHICTFYPSVLHFNYKNQIYSGKLISNSGKGKYEFTTVDHQKMIVPYSRSTEAYQFRKHLNLLRNAAKIKANQQ